MSERTSRPVEKRTRPRASLLRKDRWPFIVAILIVFIGGGIGTFFFFRNLARGDLVAAQESVEQLRSENQALKRQVVRQTADLTATKAKLAQVEARLNTIMPSENVYNMTPNETRVVADGRLTVGLIGAPGNESITLNINGKQQTAIAGQPISIGLDASTNCNVVVQSFDMFSAVLTASCAGAKPR